MTPQLEEAIKILRSQGTEPGDFKHLDRLADAFDPSRPESPEGEAAFAQLALRQSLRLTPSATTPAFVLPG